jgi:hypothetical protein
MFMLALALGCSGRVVQAQGAESTLPPLRYEAPGSCPDRSFFMERMRARLLADGARALRSLSLRVKLESSVASIRGELEIDRGASSATRSLEAKSCREVVEGLALIAALAVATPGRESTSSNKRVPAGSRVDSKARSTASRTRAQDVAEPSRAPEPRSQPTATADRSASTHSTQDTPNPDAPDARTRTAPRDELPANEVADRRFEAPPTRAALHVQRAGAPEDEGASAAPAGERGDDPRFRGWSLGASLLALHGLAPAIQPGLQLTAAITLAPGALDWSVRAGGRVALEDAVSSRQGVSHFAFIGGVVQLCATGKLGSSALHLSGCAVAEPGRFSASADQTRNPHSYRRPWLAAGAGADFSARVAHWLAVRAGVEALVPTRRDRMLLAGELVYRVAPIGLRLQLGVEVPLE